MLQIRNVRKIYSTGKHKVEALKGISLDFPKTGLVFIVGKSGSGKSTLLNILGGLDKMSSGEIVIDGKSTSSFSSSDFDAFRNYYIGFIFQDFNLIDEISVYDNIALALKIQAKGHDTNTIEDSLKMVGLEGLGYRKPNELSGGQRQRVSIARALVKDPHIILADEPTGALDSKTGEALIVSLKTLSKNKLIIVVTHDEEMAINYGDEIIEIADGRVINHFVANDSNNEGIKDEILPNLIKYSNGSELKSIEEISSKINDDETNYLCINTSKEIVSLAYSDSFPYLYERKEANNRFDEVEKEASKEVIRSKEKKINNKAHIKLKECIKMALQSFKRKKNRFISLILISIASLYLFSLGWLFSTINIPSIVANNIKDIDIPVSYVYKSHDLYEYNKLEVTEEVREELTNKYGDIFALSTSMPINYLNPSMSSSSIFSMNNFYGIVEANDFSILNFDIEGSSTPNDKEIIITDYAANELVRTGYIGNINNNIEIIYPQEINDLLNANIGLQTNLNNDKDYKYYKIVGIIDTDYEKYQNLISKTITSSYLSDESNEFEIKKEYYYSMIYAKEGFTKTNIVINSKQLNGDMFLKSNYIYNDNEYISDLYYYFDSGSYQYNQTYDIKKLEELTDEVKVVYGEIPSKLEEDQIILTLNSLSYLMEDSSNKDAINKFMETFSVTSFDFQQYKTNAMVSTHIYDELKVVAVIDADYNNFFVVSDVLFDKFINKINTIQFTDLMFALPTSKESTQKMLNNLYIEGYEIGQIVGVDSYVKDLVDYTGPVLIYVSIFFAVFAFLIVLNFISSSVKSRKKEVGILRSMGARNKDVLKIFGTEILVMAILITIVTLFLVRATVNGVNDTVTGIISLTIIKNVFIFIVCILFLSIASIIPLIKILRHNPIDAIRKIF